MFALSSLRPELVSGSTRNLLFRIKCGMTVQHDAESCHFRLFDGTSSPFHDGVRQFELKIGHSQLQPALPVFFARIYDLAYFTVYQIVKK